MLPNPEIREVTLEDYLKILRKNRRLITALLIILPLSATIYVFSVKPVYRATTSMLIEKTPPRITKFEEVGPPSRYQGIDTMQFYQTQLKILGSRMLAEAAFNDLRLSRDPEFRNLKDPAKRIVSQTKVEAVRNSQIVLINVEDTDPLRAGSIANAIAKAYIRQDVDTRNMAAKEAATWLETQLDDIRKRMQEAESTLNKYIQQNRIVAVPDIEKKTETLLENLRKERSKIETDLADNSKRYKEKHPKIISLKALLDDTNRKIEQETTNLLDLNQKMVQYHLLKKEVDSTQQLYTSMLTRAKEASVSEKIEASSIRIIDYAKPPTSPIRPKKTRTIMFWFMIAGLSGIAASFILEYLDSTIRTAEDIRVYVGLPFLGYIPSVGKGIKTDADKDLISYKEPESAVAEAFRTVRTSILFASPEDRPLKTLLITSALAQEGKSFVCTNLSTIFSQLNERIVLVDVDMRKPRIYKTFNLPLGVGLSDFLTGNANLDTVIQPTLVKNLSLITAGTIPPNPSELLTSKKTKALLEELSTRFDKIILDSPPILSVSDTSILTNMIDGVVLTIKGGNTDLRAVTRAKEKIVEAKGRIIGAIINNIEIEKEDYYYYHYYYGEEDKKGAV